ncbi:hypothetical protein NPIL_157291 [Nephila pilipes]|uniref:Uncharacterized protein n=1 Tax=Nephila pilipes TaxID=299642 RepID=A0A8X6JQ68_NEPPI|nr:hypothetical protein NPIL_157291 [Nephila pilipes]
MQASNVLKGIVERLITLFQILWVKRAFVRVHPVMSEYCSRHASSHQYIWIHDHLSLLVAHERGYRNYAISALARRSSGNTFWVADSAFNRNLTLIRTDKEWI